MSQFDESVEDKYGKLKTVKSFLELSVKAYDDNLDGLLKFLSEDNETLEKNMLTEMNDETVSEFVNKYGINPEILLRLLTKLGDSFVEPLVEGYYDRTNDFGEITNSEYRKKKKKKGKKKVKAVKSVSQKKIKPKKKPKDRQRAQTNALYKPANIKAARSAPKMSNRGRVKSPRTPKTPKISKISKVPRTPKTPKSPRTPKTPKKSKKKSPKQVTPKISKKKSTESTSKSNAMDNVPEIELDIDETKAVSDTDIKEEKQEEQKELQSQSYALMTSNSLDEYLKHYYLKFVHFNPHKKQSLTYPLSWTCLFYHQMGADFEFDILEDVNDEKEMADILWKEWIDEALCVNKTEYDSDDNSTAADNDDALLTQVPDFIYDFYKNMNESYDIYHDQNSNQQHRIYTYRIRRWISADLQEAESKTIPDKFKHLPKYSWVADKISYLDDYMLTDDLIVIQNTNLLNKPTWFKWLDEENDIHMDFLRNSGFFKHKNKSGIYSLLNETKVNILDNGICGVGDFKFGANPGEDLDLYGIIRLDVLVPSLVRYPLYKTPIINLGKSVMNHGVICEELKCKLPVIQNGGLCFDNMQRYENQRGNKDMAICVDLKPLIQNYNVKGELSDIWTLYLCFAHPMCNKKDERSTILFKQNCMDISIENTYDNTGKKLMKEELVLKIFSVNSGSRFIEIFRKKIKSNTPTNVNTLIISFNINSHKIFCSLNGRQLTLFVDEMNRTNLLNLKKSSKLLLGHKCTSSDTGTIQNLFNGYLFEFCIYPKSFHEFELRSFQQQCKVHIKKYCKMLQHY